MADREHRSFILGMVLTLAAFAVSMGVIPPLITTIAADIGADYSRFGCIIMIQFVGFFLAGIVGGWVSERFNLNSRRLVQIGLVLVCITLLAGTLLRSLTGFMVWALPLGIGGGLVEVFGSVMISSHEKPDSSKLMNLSQVFFCIGAISAPQVVSLLLYMGVSWQMVMVIFSGFVLGIMSLFLFLTRNEGDMRSRIVVKDIPHIPLLQDRMFYLLAATMFIYVTVETVIGSWISVYFEKALSCSPYTAALRISAFWFGLILGRLTVFVVPRRFCMWPPILFGAAAMLVPSLLASLTDSSTIVTVLVILAGIGAGPIWPTIVAVSHTTRHREKFTSSVIAIGAIGVSVGSLFGGYIMRHLGFGAFFPVVASIALLLLALAYASRRAAMAETLEIQTGE